MSIGINSIRAAAERFTGFYKKKGCVETATNIGKELIDLQKSGKIITHKDIYQVVKHKAPHIKLPYIATYEDELIAIMEINKMNELQQAYLIKSAESESIRVFFS